MNDDELYVYELGDRKKLKGIGGMLLIIASLNIVYFMINLFSYCNVSQVKLACVLTRDLKLPEEYFNVANLGYSILVFFSMAMIFCFYKKFKIYKYLEIISLLLKICLLVALCYTLGGINYVFHELTGFLPTSISLSFVTIIYLFNSYRVKNTFIN